LIERFTRKLPSIAVLVDGEDDVRPLAEALHGALSGQNIRVVACPGGQVVGQDNDVRVFDVQHIKGLEFEAVFFIGIDKLAARKPDLFDKYLYVGATRAATYLGLTCTCPDVPERIVALEKDRSRVFRFAGELACLRSGLLDFRLCAFPV
jgi:DNA helicase IV